jgi:hypothetical protein
MSTLPQRPSVTFVDSVKNRSLRLFPLAQHGINVLYGEVNSDNTITFWFVRPGVNMHEVHVFIQ